MDKLTKQFFGDAKRLQLSSQEKAVLWDRIATMASSKEMSLSSLEKADCFERIVQHMRSHPIAPTQSNGLSAFWRFHKLVASTLIAILIIGAGGGSAAYAAQAAVPGDTLYSLKVDVTEPLIDMAVSLDPEWAAEWERRRIKRRLKEAEHLTSHEELTEDHRVLLERRVERRMERLQEHLNKMPEEQRTRVQERVDDVMVRHQQFLDIVVEEMPLPPEEIRVFKEHVQAMRNQARNRWEPRMIPPPQNLPASDMQNAEPSVQSPAEGWLSGRKRTTRNRVDPQGSRGFESPSLRQQFLLPEVSREEGEDLPNTLEKMSNKPFRTDIFFRGNRENTPDRGALPPPPSRRNMPEPVRDLSL